MDEASLSITDGRSTVVETITSELQPPIDGSTSPTRVYTITPTEEGLPRGIHAFKIRGRLGKQELLLPDGTDASGSEHYSDMKELTMELIKNGFFKMGSTSVSLYWHPENDFYICDESEQPEQPEQPEQSLIVAKEAEQLTAEQSASVDQIIAQYNKNKGHGGTHYVEYTTEGGDDRRVLTQRRYASFCKEANALKWMSLSDYWHLMAAIDQVCESDPTDPMYRTIIERLKPAVS
jgi:hypothetical protein